MIALDERQKDVGFHFDVKMEECGASEFAEKILARIDRESIKALEVHRGEGIAAIIYVYNAQVLYVDRER